MKNNNQSGFTIVELLVVIVIIAIISAIIMVSYSATQARSRAASAQSLANQTLRKAEGWRSVLGSYPTNTQLSTGKINAADTTQTGPAESRIDDPSIMLNGASVNPTNEKQVGYRSCTVGAQVEYYDAMARAVQYIGTGGASSSAACT